MSVPGRNNPDSRQYPLTVVIAVRDEAVAKLRRLLADEWTAGGGIRDQIGEKIPALHFIAIGVHAVPSVTPLLVIEATSDMPGKGLIRDLVANFGDAFVRLLSHCVVGSGMVVTDSKQAQKALMSHSRKSACFFNGHPGRSVERIGFESELASRVVHGLRNVGDTEPSMASRVTLLKRCWRAVGQGQTPPNPGAPWHRGWARQPWAGLILVTLAVVLLPLIVLAAFLFSGWVLFLALPRFVGQVFPVLFSAGRMLVGNVFGSLAGFLKSLAVLAVFSGLTAVVLMLIDQVATSRIASAIWFYLDVPILVVICASAVIGVIGLALFHTEHWEFGIVRASSEPEEVARQNRIQNHYFNITYVKPNILRLFLLWIWLKSLSVLGVLHFNKGLLGRISTIHFARWLLIRGRRGEGWKLLFCANFDFSADSYVGDFANRAGAGVNGIWSHTIGFPVTRWMFFGGSKDRDRFTDYARSMEFQTDFWFQRYPELSVEDVNVNSVFRDSLYTAESEGRGDETAIRKVFNR